MRLDKFMSEMGVMSRKECAKVVKRGGITVNGVPAKRADIHIDPENDAVAIAGEPIRYSEFVYIMMNKPAGILSATEDPRQETVLDLLPEKYKKMKLFPSGRLDKDTTGFLLLTNDGELSHKLLSPKHHVEKQYSYSLRDELSEEDRVRVCSGIDIGEKNITAPAKIFMGENKRDGVITITEGKYHQIKRMFAAVGNEVVRLERITFGGLELDPVLERGQWRELTEKEIETLKNNGEKN